MNAGSRYGLWLAAGLGPALAIAGMVVQDPAWVGMMRMAALLQLGLLAGDFLARDEGQFLLSPNAMLGAVILLAYCLLPAIWHWTGWPVLDVPLSPELIRRTASYVGSRAETLAIGFGVLCLMAEAILALALRPRPGGNGSNLDGRGFMGLVVAGFVAALAIGLITVMNGMPRTVVETGRPLAILIMAALAVLAVGAGPWRSWTVVLVSVLIMVAAHGAGVSKLMLCAAVTAILYITICDRNVALMRLAWLAVAAATALMTLVGVFYMEVSHALPRSTQGVLNGLISKGVFRQADTGYCLDRVLDRRLDGNSGNPLYFTMVLVPRVFWPEKPVISRGDYYSDEYCPFGDGKRDPARVHSASITLLGEPVERAGKAGLGLGMTLVLGLGVVVSAIGRRGTYGKVFMLASLPWMMDFDQQLSLYIGNLVKAWLVIGSVLVSLRWISARRRRSGKELGV